MFSSFKPKKQSVAELNVSNSYKCHNHLLKKNEHVFIQRWYLSQNCVANNERAHGTFQQFQIHKEEASADLEHLVLQFPRVKKIRSEITWGRCVEEFERKRYHIDTTITIASDFLSMKMIPTRVIWSTTYDTI